MTPRAHVPALLPPLSMGTPFRESCWSGARCRGGREVLLKEARRCGGVWRPVVCLRHTLAICAATEFLLLGPSPSCSAGQTQWGEPHGSCKTAARWTRCAKNCIDLHTPPIWPHQKNEERGPKLHPSPKDFHFCAKRAIYMSPGVHRSGLVPKGCGCGISWTL